MQSTAVSCAWVLAGLLLLAACPVEGAPEPAAERFEVLQAAVHPLSSLETTRQPLTHRCVLLELFDDPEGASNAKAREAADALLNNTTRLSLAFAQFDPPHPRADDYYRASLVPTAIFDGTIRDFGGDAQTPMHYQNAYAAASAKAARASINVSSTTVITSGHLDYEVFVPDDLTGYTVTVRAMLVEDPVPSTEAGGDLRFVARSYLAGDHVALHGNSSQSGRLEYTLDSSWVESRLSALVFVQVDTPPPGTLLPAHEPTDVLGAVIVPLAALVTGVILAVIVVRYVTADRRARLR